MNRVAAEVWRLIYETPDDDDRVALARWLWDKHGEEAGIYAGMVSVLTVIEVSEAAADGALHSQRPDDETLARYNGDVAASAAAGQAVWNFIAKAVHSQKLGVVDPFLEDEHATVVREHQGLAVFWFTHWATAFLLWAAEHDSFPWEQVVGDIEKQLPHIP